MVDFSKELEKARIYTRYDISHSWHKHLRPKEHFLENTKICPYGTNWQEILESFKPKLCQALAPNQKEYSLCLYPYTAYVLHYLCVVILSKKLPFAWFARSHKSTLSTNSSYSLLLGRSQFNQKKFQQWKQKLETMGTKNDFNTQCIRIDIENFFGSIDTKLLLKMIKEKLKTKVNQGKKEKETHNPQAQKEKIILELLEKIFLLFPNGLGLPIGNTPERFFSNIYLDPIDQLIIENYNPKVKFLRYIDDIRLYGKEENLDKLVLCLFAIKNEAEQYGLNLHPLKTGLVTPISPK